MNFMPIISIVVPIYNQEKYLEKCINSLLVQTYTELEIILVDDGSTDKSGAICDVFAQKDSRIKVIHKENGGLSDARNAGIDIARGEYIGFVDSDDYVAENIYEKMYNVLAENNADMVVCNCALIDSNNQLIEEKKYQFIDQICSGMEIINGKFITEESYFLTVVAWNKLLRKEIFSVLRYPRGRYHEDEFIFHELYSQAARVICIDDKLYFYRQAEGTITDSKNVWYRLDRVEAMYERIKYCLEAGCFENILFFEKTMYYSLEAVLLSTNIDKENKKKMKQFLKMYKEVLFKLYYIRKINLIFLLDRYWFLVGPKLRNLGKRVWRRV